MDAIRNIPTADLVFYFVLYGCLPLWVIFGFVDYLCHRATRIEHNTGIKESILHCVMGVQVGLPVMLGLHFQINVLLFLVMFAVLVFHEWVAHQDVLYARGHRQISIVEMHAHSFLEVIPFGIVALIICINWPAFMDFVTLNWSGHMGLQWRENPLSTTYVNFYVILVLLLGVLPYTEELLRCWRHRKEATG